MCDVPGTRIIRRIGELADSSTSGAEWDDGSYERNLPRVVIDPEILRATSVFKDSHVPIEVVLARVDAGTSWEVIIANWPWLTPEHVVPGRAWAMAHRTHPKVR